MVNLFAVRWSHQPPDADHRFGHGKAESLTGLGQAAFIAGSALFLALQAVDLLMDRELSEEDRTKIKAVATGVPGVLGVHELRTRRSGHIAVIQLHVELADDQPLRRAHAISDRVEADLRTEFPGADITIHQDPAGLAENQRRD